MSGLCEAAQSGDQLKTLRCLRDKLAESIDNADNGHDVSALSNQLTNVLKQIAELEKATGKHGRRTSIEKARKAAKRG